MTTAADLLLQRADDDSPAFLFEDQVWTYGELAEQGLRRAAMHAELHDPDRPPHIGVLLATWADIVFGHLVARAVERIPVTLVLDVHVVEPISGCSTVWHRSPASPRRASRSS